MRIMINMEPTYQMLISCNEILKKIDYDINRFKLTGFQKENIYRLIVEIVEIASLIKEDVKPGDIES